MLVQRVRNLQPADECECRGILTAAGNFSQLALELNDVGLEAVALPHFYVEDVVVVILGFLTRGVLGGECFDYLLEVVERMSQHGVEPIRGHAFQTGWKGYAQERIVVGVNYHIVPKVPNVLNRVTSSGTRTLKSLRRGESETGSDLFWSASEL